MDKPLAMHVRPASLFLPDDPSVSVRSKSSSRKKPEPASENVAPPISPFSVSYLPSLNLMSPMRRERARYAQVPAEAADEADQADKKNAAPVPFADARADDPEAVAAPARLVARLRDSLPRERSSHTFCVIGVVAVALSGRDFVFHLAGQLDSRALAVATKEVSPVATGAAVGLVGMQAGKRFFQVFALRNARRADGSLRIHDDSTGMACIMLVGCVAGLLPVLTGYVVASYRAGPDGDGFERELQGAYALIAGRMLGHLTRDGLNALTRGLLPSLTFFDAGRKLSTRAMVDNNFDRNRLIHATLVYMMMAMIHYRWGRDAIARAMHITPGDDLQSQFAEGLAYAIASSMVEFADAANGVVAQGLHAWGKGFSVALEPGSCAKWLGNMANWRETGRVTWANASARMVTFSPSEFIALVALAMRDQKQPLSEVGGTLIVAGLVMALFMEARGEIASVGLDEESAQAEERQHDIARARQYAEVVALAFESLGLPILPRVARDVGVCASTTAEWFFACMEALAQCLRSAVRARMPGADEDADADEDVRVHVEQPPVRLHDFLGGQAPDTPVNDASEIRISRFDDERWDGEEDPAAERPPVNMHFGLGTRSPQSVAQAGNRASTP